MLYLASNSKITSCNEDMRKFTFSLSQQTQVDYDPPTSAMQTFPELRLIILNKVFLVEITLKSPNSVQIFVFYDCIVPIFLRNSLVVISNC